MAHRLPLIGLSLALGWSVSGCAVGPDYQAPSAQLAVLHNAASVEARPAVLPAPPLDTWWSGFHDPALTRIVERALAQNLDLAASLARVAEARAAAREAGAQSLPTADLTTQATSLRQSLDSPVGAIASHLPGYSRNQTLYDSGLGASWEIDLFGGLQRGTEAAEAEAEAAEAEHAGVRISVAAEAADAYVQIRGDQARLQLAEDQIATDAHLLDLVHLRAASGVATDREIAQAEALLAQAQATVPPLRTALEAQLNRLDVLMGAQPGTYAMELAVPGSIPNVPAVNAGREPSDLLRRRPDVIAAERRLAAANARIGGAIADYYPKVSLAGLLGFESLGSGQMFHASTFQPQATAGLRWRLFDFGKVDAEVAQADQAHAAALAQYRQSVLHAAEDVEDAFYTLVQDEAQTRELSREVNALTHARDTSVLAYQGGLIGLTDVLDADRQLLAAQDDHARTQADSARAAVASYRALGGGW